MNHGNHIKYMDVIRFRNGASALMRVYKMDTLCGYVTYHGMHLYGERISIAGDQCRKANSDELKLWNEFRGARKAHAHNVNAEEDLEWAS